MSIPQSIVATINFRSPDFCFSRNSRLKQFILKLIFILLITPTFILSWIGSGKHWAFFQLSHLQPNLLPVSIEKFDALTILDKMDIKQCIG